MMSRTSRGLYPKAFTWLRAVSLMESSGLNRRTNELPSRATGRVMSDMPNPVSTKTSDVEVSIRRQWQISRPGLRQLPELSLTQRSHSGHMDPQLRWNTLLIVMSQV